MSTPNCPKCGGQMWDERAGKFWGTGKFPNGKSKPLYKCRDKECATKGGVLWKEVNAPKESEAESDGARTQAKSGAVSGGNGTPAGTTASRPQLAPLYTSCLLTAKGIVEQHLPDATPADVLAATATLYIAATRAGVSSLFGEDGGFPEALKDKPDRLPFD